MCRQKLRGAKSLTLYLPMSQTLVSLITNTVLAYVTDIGVSNYLPWLFFFFACLLLVHSTTRVQAQYGRRFHSFITVPQFLTQSGNSVDT